MYSTFHTRLVPTREHMPPANRSLLKPSRRLRSILCSFPLDGALSLMGSLNESNFFAAGLRTRGDANCLYPSNHECCRLKVVKLMGKRASDLAQVRLANAREMSPTADLSCSCAQPYCAKRFPLGHFISCPCRSPRPDHPHVTSGIGQPSLQCQRRNYSAKTTR